MPVAPTESHNSPIPVGDLRARQGAAAAGTGAVVGNECTCGRSRGRSIVRMVGGKRKDAPVCSCDGTPAPPPRCCAGAMRKKTTTAGFENLKILKSAAFFFLCAESPRQDGMSIAQVAFALFEFVRKRLLHQSSVLGCISLAAVGASAVFLPPLGVGCCCCLLSFDCCCPGLPAVLPGS